MTNDRVDLIQDKSSFNFEDYNYMVNILNNEPFNYQFTVESFSVMSPHELVGVLDELLVILDL